MAANIVIVGTGAFATTHADALLRQTRLRLHGFVGSTPASSLELSSRYGVLAYSSFDDVLADDAVDAVIIATPHASHHRLGMDALRANKHVLIEKPLANSTDECEHLIAASHASSARAMVGHLMRWAPAHRQARKLIEEGMIGEIVAVDSRRVIDWNEANRRPWQKSRAAGGGMWLVQGVHVIDQVSFLLGARAEDAFGLAETRFHADQSADDLGMAQLSFGSIHARLLVAGTRGLAPQVHTELLGTRGQMRVSHRGELVVDLGQGWQDRLEPVPDHWNGMIDAEIAAFADCIEGAPAEVGFDYGRYVVSTVEAVLRSAATGAKVRIQ
ncbi:Gfo/Idh/MocA family protein [Devosia faecipullorum]|uniref:Gfo/Idh/MocA family protein n=1 Tax=Devosia faecipullorum TaxID=2755039 RepID=UPI00187BAB1F|nr:Gfo/Idh/MocA family oxidoreductase [Devosia faecipullorum]MBE7732871.1 Gfo/Idh/MocA family oxidoreductase [Devosia faecipullorum]